MNQSLDIWEILFAFIVFVVVCVGLISDPERITIPQVGAVQLVEMERFNEGASLGIVAVTEEEHIAIILTNLLGAKKTMRTSTNDSPIQNNYLVVRLMLEGERRTLCLYSDNGNYYIEEPYVGIYKSNKDASVAVYSLYTESVDRVQAETITYIGHILDFEESNPGVLRFDLLEWINSEDTQRIEELGIETYDMPNGYYIHNPEVDNIFFKIDENTEYNFIDWGTDFVKIDEDRFYSTTDKEEFIRYLGFYSNHASRIPFWIVTRDGIVLSIDEQFVN